MADCGSLICEDLEDLSYYRLVAILAFICAIFAVLVVLYFLIIREHPSKPDETDDIEKKRFYDLRSHEGNNLCSDFMIRLKLNFPFLKSCSNFRKRCCSIFTKTQSENDKEEEEEPLQELTTVVEETNDRPKKEKRDKKEKKKSSKGKSKSKKGKKSKNNNNNENFNENSNLWNDFEQIFGKQESINKKNLSSAIAQLNKNHSNNCEYELNDSFLIEKCELADACVYFGYIQKDKRILILVSSIINKSTEELYEVRLSMDIFYNKQFKSSIISGRLIEKIPANSEVGYNEEFHVKLDENENIDLIEILVFITGKIVEEYNIIDNTYDISNLKELNRISIHGTSICVIRDEF